MFIPKQILAKLFFFKKTIHITVLFVENTFKDLKSLNSIYIFFKFRITAAILPYLELKIRKD